MLGAVSFWQGFVVCRYTWLACVYIEGSRLKATLSAFGVTRVVSQHGCVGPYPRQAQSPAGCWRSVRCPAWSIPAVSRMLPAFPISSRPAPRLFPKTRASHSQQRAVGLAALGAKGLFLSAAFSLTPAAGHSPAAPSGAPAPGAARLRRLIKAQRF